METAKQAIEPQNVPSDAANEASAKRNLLIVKVGTNVLASHGNSQEHLNREVFNAIGAEVRQLSDDGYGIILVSSGAITAGVFEEKKNRNEIKDVTEQRRYAARGWNTVVEHWKGSIGGSRVSSTLLTKRELRNESMRTKLLEVIMCCLDHNDIFIINENDCLSDDEIRFGDNDTLAAAIGVECAKANLFESIKLILLTNKDGLNEVADDDSSLIRVVTDIASVEQYAGSAANHHSRGGMITKVQAAKNATKVGVETYIANGATLNAVQKALNSKIGTHFIVK